MTRAQAVRRFFTDWMLFSDPPEHTRLRKLVSRAFVPRSIAMLESFVHQAVNDALDRVDGQDQIDIIADFGFPVPSRVIGHMLGVAQDRIGDFVQWSHAIWVPLHWSVTPTRTSPSPTGGCATWESIFGDLIAERRTVPAEDLLALMVQASEDGTVLSGPELMATARCC